MRIHRKLAIAAGAGVAGLGLFGMVALAAFAPDTGGGTRAFVAPTGAQSAVERTCATSRGSPSPARR